MSLGAGTDISLLATDNGPVFSYYLFTFPNWNGDKTVLSNKNIAANLLTYLVKIVITIIIYHKLLTVDINIINFCKCVL